MAVHRPGDEAADDVGMDREELLAALMLLASTDHFDEARRAAGLLPEDLPVAAVLRASDGVQQLARALDTRQRVAASARDQERAQARLERRASLYT